MKRIILLLLVPVALIGQDNYTQKINDYFKAEIAINQFNGNVLVAKDGKIVYQQSFGYSNYTTKEKLTANSMFELASISKQFVAAAIFQLREKGKLQLTDSLRKFIPELPYQNITLSHMLLHTSGLPDYYDSLDQKWDKSKYAYNSDVIKFLAEENLPVAFKPGERTEYSNLSFELLAVVVERVSGMPLAKYLQENIFKPLNMTHTRLYNTRRTKGEKIPGYAYGYVKDSARGYVLPDSLRRYYWAMYSDGIYGSGNISSTTNDLFVFDRALKNNLLFNKEVQSEMSAMKTLWDSTYQVYWNLAAQKAGRNEFGFYLHGGVASWPGYANEMIRYTDEDLVIIVLTNNESNAGSVSGALAYIMNNRPVVYAYTHSEIPLKGKQLKKYVGDYTVPFVPHPLTISVFMQDNKLYYLPKEINNRVVKSDTLELRAESETKLFAGRGELQLEFEFDKSKQERAFFIFNGMKKEMRKVDHRMAYKK